MAGQRISRWGALRFQPVLVAVAAAPRWVNSCPFVVGLNCSGLRFTFHVLLPHSGSGRPFVSGANQISPIPTR